MASGPPRRYFYGYWIVPIAMLGQISTAPGQTFAISAFTPALRESLQLSDSQLAAAYMLGTFLAAFPLLLIGPLADRIGNRAMMLLCVVGLALTCLLTSLVTALWMLLIAFLLLRLLGQGALSLLSQNTAAIWFHAKLGRVTAAMSVGMAAAFALIPGGLVAAIDAIGWRNTYRLMGLLVAVVMVPLLIFVYRDHPHDVGQYPDGLDPRSGDDEPSPASEAKISVVELQSFEFGQAVRFASYWIVAITMAVWALIGTGVVFYLFDIGAAAGLQRETTSRVFLTFAISMLGAQLLAGPLADRYRLNVLLCIAVALLAVGTTTLLGLREFWHFQLFGLLFGSGQGLALVVGATVWVRYFGPRHLGKIRGTAWSIAVAGSGAGPFILGAVRDRTGSFFGGIVGFALTLAVLAVASLFAVSPQRSSKPRTGADAA